jgi:hypothetical protein
MKCEKCKNDMVVDPTKLLLSDPPKPSYLCPICQPEDIKPNNTIMGFTYMNMPAREINWDAVSSVDDIKAILKCLGISFGAGKITKDIDHLLIPKI